MVGISDWGTRHYYMVIKCLSAGSCRQNLAVI